MPQTSILLFLPFRLNFNFVHLVFEIFPIDFFCSSQLFDCFTVCLLLPAVTSVCSCLPIHIHGHLLLLRSHLCIGELPPTATAVLRLPSSSLKLGVFVSLTQLKELNLQKISFFVHHRAAISHLTKANIVPLHKLTSWLVVALRLGALPKTRRRQMVSVLLIEYLSNTNKN